MKKKRIKTAHSKIFANIEDIRYFSKRVKTPVSKKDLLTSIIADSSASSLSRFPGKTL